MDRKDFFIEYIFERGGVSSLSREEKMVLLEMAKRPSSPTAYWNSLSPGTKSDYMLDAREEIKDERKALKELGYTKEDDEWKNFNPKTMAKEIAWEDSEWHKDDRKKQQNQAALRSLEKRIKEVKGDADAWKRGFCRVDGVEYQKNECSKVIRSMLAGSQKTLDKLMIQRKEMQ